MTVGVFMGFGYLLINDIMYNINVKPFTFEVKEKFMSEEECSETEIHLDQYGQSLNYLVGVQSDIF